MAHILKRTNFPNGVAAGALIAGSPTGVTNEGDVNASWQIKINGTMISLANLGTVIPVNPGSGPLIVNGDSAS